MDFELTSMGVSRLAESTPDEREKATENVFSKKKLPLSLKSIPITTPGSRFIK